MYKNNNDKYNASRIDRAPIIGKLKAKFGEFENLFDALIIYMNNLKDDGLAMFESQVEDLERKCRAADLNKRLTGKTLQGIKPDAYMLVRNGQLIIDFSYHYLLRIVRERHGKSIDVIMLEKSELAAIKMINVLDKRIIIDEAKHTELLLNSDGFNLSNIAACIVTCTDINTQEKERVYYRIKDMIAAGSSYGGASFRADSGGSPATIHKNLMMIRKTAIRMYVRDNFTDLRGLDDIEYQEEEYSENNVAASNASDVQENERVIDLKQRIIATGTLEDLELVGERIKTAGLSAGERSILIPVFMERKKALSEVSNNEVSDEE